MDIQIKVLSREEMQTLKESLVLVPIKPHYYVFEGFSLFNENKTSPSATYDHVYFVAFVEDKVVGVLKFSDSKLDEFGKVWSVSWIDVHKDYRRRGIARKLYQALNDYVSSDKIVIGTFYVEDGEAAKLHDLRKSIVTKVPCFADRMEYMEYLESQRHLLSHSE